MGSPAVADVRPATASVARRSGGLHSVLLLFGMLLLAVNLRSPIVAVSPVLRNIIDTNGLTPVVAGALTALPVLAFAILTPGAARLLARIGPDLAVGLTLAGVIIGVGVRSLGGTAFLIAGTVVIGGAITLGNVVVPMLIHRDQPPGRRATATGLYTVAINVGTMLTLLGTVPMADVVGWQLALLTWTGLAVLAFSVWIAAVGWRRAFTRAVEAPRARLLIPIHGGGVGQTVRDRKGVWRLALLAATFGAQAFSYYGLTAWLPELLAERIGLPLMQSSAGASLFQIFAIVGGLGVPLLGRFLPLWVPMGLLALCWMAVPLGLLLHPEHWPIWIAAGGVGQGGVFTLVFIVVVQTAGSAARAALSSALVQSIGYGVGATGPTALGLLFDVTGGWQVPLVGLVISTTVLALAGLFAVGGLRTDRSHRAH